MTHKKFLADLVARNFLCVIRAKKMSYLVLSYMFDQLFKSSIQRSAILCILSSVYVPEVAAVIIGRERDPVSFAGFDPPALSIVLHPAEITVI